MKIKVLKVLKVSVAGKQMILGNCIIEATSLYQRILGLMFRKSFDEIDGMILAPCNSIHTFFMRMNIHAIFLDKTNKVVKIYRNLKPWRLTPIYFKANRVLEIDAKKDISLLDEGDIIEVVCSS